MLISNTVQKDTSSEFAQLPVFNSPTLLVHYVTNKTYGLRRIVILESERQMLTELTVPLRKMSSDERDVPKKTFVAIV